MSKEKSYDFKQVATINKGKVQVDTDEVSRLISGNYKLYGHPVVIGHSVFQAVIKYRG